MAKIELTVTVTTKGSVQGYWVTIDGKGVPMDPISKTGSILVDSPTRHQMVLHFGGAPGDSATATATNAAGLELSKVGDTISAPNNHGGDFSYFAA